MNAKHLFAFGAAAMMLSACSSDEPATGSTNPPATDGKYLSIRISDAVDARAAQIDYYEGTDEEKAIDMSKLRFFFFDDNGNPVAMHGTGSNNMVEPLLNDVEPGDADDAASAATAKSFILTVSPTDFAYPTRVVTVANDANAETFAGQTLQQLLSKTVTDYKSGEHFIMTSASAWANSTNTFWSTISADNIKETREEAIEAPVKIFIERVVSKVEVARENGASNAIFAKESDSNGMKITLNTTEGAVERYLYALPTGWTTNTLTSEVSNFKNIENYDIFATGTTWYLNGRTYWETTSSAVAPEQFVPATALASNAIGSSTYVLPNTADHNLAAGEGHRKGMTNYANSHATKVLVGAKIIASETATEPAADAEGVQIMLWADSYYTPTALCNSLRGSSNRNICFARNSDKTYTVNFYTTTDASKHGKLVDAATAATLTPMSSAPAAEYWNGMGYYILNVYGDLLSANDTPAYGIVRNQLYKYNLQKFIGLGTPVVDPASAVYPENPINEQTFVTASLNLFKWRVMSHNVNLE